MSFTDFGDVTAETIEEVARVCASRFTERGMTAAKAQEEAANAAKDPRSHPSDASFWEAVAAELDLLEAATEARRGWSVIDGGATGRRNPLTRRWAIADRHAQSPLALVTVPEGK